MSASSCPGCHGPTGKWSPEVCSRHCSLLFACWCQSQHCPSREVSALNRILSPHEGNGSLLLVKKIRPCSPSYLFLRFVLSSCFCPQNNSPTLFTTMPTSGEKGAKAVSVITLQAIDPPSDMHRCFKISPRSKLFCTLFSLKKKRRRKGVLEPIFTGCGMRPHEKVAYQLC